MSLTVYLILKGHVSPAQSDVIFVRINGAQTQISREEWDRLFPGREPIVTEVPSTGIVYDANITHNLGVMAEKAGLYQYLWRPDEIDITLAGQLIEPLQTGLTLLESDRERFEKYNPSNGWGSYEGLVRFVKSYLEACKNFPEAQVEVSK